MLKILQVTGTMNRGGAEVMLMDILRNKPADIHFDFLVNNPPDDLYRDGAFDKEIRNHKCEIRYIGTQLRIGPINYIRTFKRIYDDLRPDVIHIHLNGKCGIIALAAYLAGCRKIIVHSHADIRFRGTLLSRIFNETELFFQKFLIAFCATDWWGCSMEANKRLYWPWVRKDSIVINNAINCDLYQDVRPESVNTIRFSYNLPESTLVLGNIGRIVPHKNIAFVIDIMYELQHRGIDVAFVIVGRNDSPDYTNALRNRAKELNIQENRLLFLGERDDIPAVMHTFDVFVGPALKEGFGLVALEAQASSVPCVLYKGFPRAVDMQMGLCTFLDDFDAKEWAEAIISSIAIPAVEKELIHERIRNMGFDAKSNSRLVCARYLQ